MRYLLLPILQVPLGLALDMLEISQVCFCRRPMRIGTVIKLYTSEARFLSVSHSTSPSILPSRTSLLTERDFVSFFDEHGSTIGNGSFVVHLHVQTRNDGGEGSASKEGVVRSTERAGYVH